MKKVVKETKKDEGVKELKGAFVLWDQKSKTGTKYLSGQTSLPEGEEGFRVIAFYNTNKKNPKEPDIRVYAVNDEGKQGDEVAALWESLSKNNARYLTGSDNEKKNIIAFYTDLKKHPDAPIIRAYYKDEE